MLAAIVYGTWAIVMGYVAASIYLERRRQRMDEEARCRSEYAAKLAAMNNGGRWGAR